MTEVEQSLWAAVYAAEYSARRGESGGSVSDCEREARIAAWHAVRSLRTEASRCDECAFCDGRHQAFCSRLQLEVCARIDCKHPRSAHDPDPLKGTSKCGQCECPLFIR